MTPEELKALLGIKMSSSEATPSKKKLKIKKLKEEVPLKDDLPLTAVKLDKWDLFEGERVLGRRDREKEKLTKEDMADFHAVLYLPEFELHEECASPRRMRFIQTLLESSAYKSL